MDIKGIIQEKLAEIEEKEHIKILLAVESGSRAWGFASPDSDYDVRFIYVRPFKEYLHLNEQKDFIEWQLDDVLDINGWDLNKTLIQFRKGNATLFEWSNSPVVYQKDPLWDTIYETAKNYFSAKSSLYHYYGTARNTFEGYLQGENVKYKKYFYALRPLLACKYIDEHNCPPPVLFDKLLQMELPQELREGIDHLLELKKVTDEKDLNPQIPVIYEFIKKELEVRKVMADTMKDDHNKDWDALNALFFDIIMK